MKSEYDEWLDKQRESGNIPPGVDLVLRAEIAIKYLMDREGHVDYTKEEFARVMNWYDAGGKPNRRLVEDVCNLTRDQELKEPWVQEKLAGYVIVYADRRGLLLLDPGATEMPLDHQVYLIRGDLRRQQQHKTENRRRLSGWATATKMIFNAGDQELAKLFAQAEDQVDKAGFVDDHTVNEIEKVLSSRGWTKGAS